MDFLLLSYFSGKQILNKDNSAFIIDLSSIVRCWAFEKEKAEKEWKNRQL